MENPFVKLFAIDFKDHLEVKKSGNTELKYVSWAYAWAEVKSYILLPAMRSRNSTVCPMFMTPSPASWCTPQSRLRAFRTKCGFRFWTVPTKL